MPRLVNSKWPSATRFLGQIDLPRRRQSRAGRTGPHDAETLWAVHDAAQLIRAPLASSWLARRGAEAEVCGTSASRQAAARRSRNDMARMCDLPLGRSANATDRAKSEAHQGPALKPRGFAKKSFEMGQFLMASCFKPMPATPEERLDAADRPPDGGDLRGLRPQHGAQRFHQPAQR